MANRVMEGRPSRTAEHVALVRALETVRRGPRLFHDPYAAAFLSSRYRVLAAVGGLPLLGRGLEHVIDRVRSPGARMSLVVRTRLIDDLLVDALDDGVRQVVILGAGYDCRALRLPAMGGASVFEVDHPTTQRRKREALGSRVPPDQLEVIRFVPVDLACDSLADALRRAGFRPHRSVVVWEGVVAYLSAEAVDATLGWMAGATAAGSRLIFTYIDRGAVDGTGGFAGAMQWSKDVRGVGEPFRFGFDPAELKDYMAERGLTLDLDLSAAEAGERYLRPPGRRERPAEFSRIAQATVC